MYVLDTNTLVYFFRGEGDVSTNLLNHEPGEIVVPSLVVWELEVGIGKAGAASRRRKQFEAFLATVQVAPFGIEEARCAADIRLKLERRGIPIGPIDTLIAGTALARKAVLVTRNVREFGRVEGLRVENWY